MKAAVEYSFTDTAVAYTSYDSTKINLGTLMHKETLPNSVGPLPIAIGRPFEQQPATAVLSWMVCSVPWSSDINWVFMIQGTATAALATRRIHLYTHTISTNVLAYIGVITAQGLLGAGTFTIRGMRASLERYTVGTASVAGTAVTGTATLWQTDRLCAGSRIGFGSTNPTAIVNWYQIASIDAEGGITLASNAGVVPDGPYVIEDFRIFYSQTGATANLGAPLILLKGLSYEDFNPVAGTNISHATTVDNIKAVYELVDDNTFTNTTIGGCAIEDRVNWQTQYVDCLNGTTSLKIYRYNIRAALTFAGETAPNVGRTRDALVLVTGAQGCTGTCSQVNNGRIGTLVHQGSVPSLYFATTTRVYRVPLTQIVGGSTTFLSGSTDTMIEVHPGSATTVAASAALQSVEIASSIDRLIIMSTSATGFHSYVSRYITDGSQIDRWFLIDDKFQNSSTADPDAPTHPNTISTVCSAWSEQGICYLLRHGTAATTNVLFGMPLSADWDFAATNPITSACITPKIATTGATKLYSAYTSHVDYYGSSSLGLPADGWRTYYRTSGIDDNSGAWTLLGNDGDLSGAGAPSYIQFRFEFRCISPTCLTPRILKVAVLYETDTYLPPELQWRFADSNNTDGTVGFSQISAFSVLPTLTISYYRSDNDALVLTQASSGSVNGVFEYWTGAAWAAGLGTNTVGIRRRFRPTAGLPTGTDVYAKIVAT